MMMTLGKKLVSYKRKWATKVIFLFVFSRLLIFIYIYVCRMFDKKNMKILIYYQLFLYVWRAKHRAIFVLSHF